MQTIAEPSPLSDLWRRLGAMFARARAVVGAVEALARLTWLDRRRRHEIACWLARLECIARKLLFAEAAAMAREPLAPRRVRRQTCGEDNARGLQSPAYDPALPHTWPARFKLAPPRDPRAVPEARAPRIRALWDDAWSNTHTRLTGATHSQPAGARVRQPIALRFALRMEALRRVLADPSPHARRLARIFHRLSRRFPEAARRYAIAGARPHAFDLTDPRLIIEAYVKAFDAAPALADTS